MAADSDRQSDGRPSRERRRALSELRVGVHTIFQLAWLLALAVLAEFRVAVLVHEPAPGAATKVVEVTAIWGLGAGLAWLLRVSALTGCGRWGARTRQRIRDGGRRRGADR